MRCVLSAVRDHLQDQLSSVLNARAELALALLHVGPDEEQPAVPGLREGQSVVQICDAAGSWEVLLVGQYH